MALYMVLEDFAGNVGTAGPSAIPISAVGSGTLLDDTLYDIPRLLADGCPLVLYNPATMGAAKTAFDKMSGGLAQINPDGNLLALLFATGVISGAIGPSNVAFVNVEGTALGVVGNAGRPFATVKQALDALAAAGLALCQVRIGPGSFIADVGAVPAALTNLSIIGGPPQSTIVQTATPGSNLFDLGVNVARDNFIVIGFSISAPGGLAIRYDGGAKWALGLAFAAGALAVGCPILSGGVDVKRLGTLASPGPAAQFYGPVNIEQVVQVLALSGPVFGAGLTFSQDWDDPARGGNSLGNLTMTLGFVGGDIVVSKQARVEAYFSNCDGTIHGTLTKSLGGISGGGVSWRNGVVRNVDFRNGANILPVTAGCTMDFSGSTIRENAEFKVAGAGVDFQDVDLRQCRFDMNTVPLIGHNCHCDGRGAVVWGPFYFGTPDDTGDVKSDTFTIGPVDVVALGVNPVPMAMPFRLASANYAAVADSDDATTLPLAATARTALQVDFQVAVIAGNLRAIITPVNN